MAKFTLTLNSTTGPSDEIQNVLRSSDPVYIKNQLKTCIEKLDITQIDFFQISIIKQ